MLSGHEVAVGNIWERELPGPDGTLASRMSAIVSVLHRETGEEWTMTVVEGDTIVLRRDVYLVGSIEAARDSRGTMTLVPAD